MENTNTIDLRMLFSAILRKLSLILACTILGAALLFAYATFYIPDRYRTSVHIIVHNAKTTGQTTTTSDINAANMLSEQFISILKMNAVLEDVSHSIGDDPLTGQRKVTAAQLSKLLSLSSENSILAITATSTDKALCTEICEAMATTGAERLKTAVEASSVVRVEQSVDEIAEPARISKRIPQRTLLGALIGFILSAGIVALIAYFDDTIKSGDYFTDVLGIPMLGEVPSLKKTAGSDYKAGKSYVK